MGGVILVLAIFVFKGGDKISGKNGRSFRMPSASPGRALPSVFLTLAAHGLPMQHLPASSFARRVTKRFSGRGGRERSRSSLVSFSQRRHRSGAPEAPRHGDDFEGHRLSHCRKQRRYDLEAAATRVWRCRPQTGWAAVRVSVTVLGKVQVINDVVQDHPYLIMVNLFATDNEAYSIFEAALEGHRVTMAATGYFRDGKPCSMTGALRVCGAEESDHLQATAGKHKGRGWHELQSWLPSPGNRGYAKTGLPARGRRGPVQGDTQRVTRGRPDWRTQFRWPRSPEIGPRPTSFDRMLDYWCPKR